MPKKEWTEEERKAFAEKMKASRAKKQEESEPVSEPFNPNPDVVDEVKNGLSQDEANAILTRLKELEAKLASVTPQTPEAPRISSQGNLVGEFEKYTVNPANYADFTERLRKEPKLAPHAFEYNYQLDYEFSVSPYERKDGINAKEPRFKFTLSRIQLDEDGNQTNGRYVIRTLFLHEDPQAAMTIANDNGIKIDSLPQVDFLNEMRYMRVRDWLLEIFYPKPSDSTVRSQEKVFGNVVVPYFESSSESPIPINKMI